MPSTLSYRPALIDTLITNERMNSYLTVFNPRDDIELMGVYLWNSHVCATMFPLISAAEISIRNAIDNSLKRNLGTFWWKASKLHYKSFQPGAPIPKVVDLLRGNFSKASSSFISEQTRLGKTNVVPNHSGIIAKTDFSTWEFILNNEFEGNNLIWPANLGQVFSGPWASSSGSGTLNTARDLVQTIRQFRNRIFHNEPAWKRYSVQNEADAIIHLHEKISKIEQLISLIHPEKLRLLQLNGLFDNARRICSSHEIKRCQHLTISKRVNSIRRLKDIVKLSYTQNEIQYVKLSSSADRCFYILPKLR